MAPEKPELGKARTLQTIIFAFGGVSIAFAVIAPRISIYHAIALYAVLNLIVTNSIVVFLLVSLIEKKFKGEGQRLSCETDASLQAGQRQKATPLLMAPAGTGGIWGRGISC